MNNSIISQSRLLHLDYLRAITIILVVIGHWQVEPMPKYWTDAVTVIYSFHMPLFFAISGYLFMHTTEKEYNYKSFLIKKTQRLVIPYIVTSIIVISIKLLSEKFMYVENPTTIISFLEILYSPSAGAYLWFVWALLWMFIVAPFFKTKASRLVLFVLTVVCAHLPWHATSLFCLAQAQIYAVYFVTGMLLFDYQKLSVFNSKLCITVGMLLFISLEVVLLCGFSEAAKLIPYVAILVLLPFFKTTYTCVNKKLSVCLFHLSIASYTIYLFHTTFEGFAKSMLLPYCTQGGVGYLLAATIAIMIGVLIPLLLYFKVFKRFAVTRFLFGL